MAFEGPPEVLVSLVRMTLEGSDDPDCRGVPDTFVDVPKDCGAEPFQGVTWDADVAELVTMELSDLSSFIGRCFRRSR
jgi:hypothetical protein